MAHSKAPDAIDKHVGQRIRLCRTLRGISMEAVAACLGVTWQQFQKYEIGRNRVSAGRLQQIADVLDCQVTDFFEGQAHRGNSSRFADPLITEFFTDRRAVKLARAFLDIADDDMQGAIVALAEAAAAKQLRKAA